MSTAESEESELLIGAEVEAAELPVDENDNDDANMLRSVELRHV